MKRIYKWPNSISSICFPSHQLDLAEITEITLSVFHSWPLLTSCSCRREELHYVSSSSERFDHQQWAWFEGGKKHEKTGPGLFSSHWSQKWWRLCWFLVAKDSCRLFVMHFSKWAREQTPFRITTWYYQPLDFWCPFFWPPWGNVLPCRGFMQWRDVCRVDLSGTPTNLSSLPWFPAMSLGDWKRLTSWGVPCDD